MSDEADLDEADLEEFLYRAAHDLRGPLNTLHLAVALLDTEEASLNEMRAVSKTISESVSSLSTVVERLERRAERCTE